MPLTWSQDEFIKAFNFAAVAHQGQCLPDSNLPYLVHISLVCMEVITLQSVEPMSNPELALQCAALHDVVEDKRAILEKIREEFGFEIANGVDALSKKKDIPNPLTDSIERIKKQPKEIWIVKLADRITNLQPPPSSWQSEKIVNYLKGSVNILENLAIASPYLASRLKAKIENYRLNYCQ